MKTVKVYNIRWYEPYADNGEDLLVEETQLDENNEELIWEMFKEFGNTRTDKTYYEVEEAEEELEDDVYESIYGTINIE